MLLKPLFLYYFQLECCYNKWFYNVSKKKKKKQVLKYFTVDMFKTNVAKTNGFSIIMFGNVVKPFVLAALFCEHVVQPFFLQH